MSYVPHTNAERSEMLKAIGVADMADLFPDVPARVRFPKLDLPRPVSELDIAREMRALGGRNVAVDPSLSFLGAGVYHHFRPAEVDHLLATVGSSGCEFYRAGSWHSARTAQAHLEHKYQYLATRQMLQSAEDFIVKAATRSSMTGEAYAIRCTPNPAQPSSTWLESELRAHRNARPAAAQPQK